MWVKSTVSPNPASGTGLGRTPTTPHSAGRLTPEDQEHIDRALTFLDLDAYADRFLDQLSGGQRQRAYVAMVLAQDTEYVLLDEPLNNLDIAHAVSMMKQLRRTADEYGKTFVIVVHDINFASAYSDHIIALTGGKVVFEGTPAEMMRPEPLRAVFSSDVHVTTHNGYRYGLYYRPA